MTLSVPFVQCAEENDAATRDALIAALLAEPPRVEPKFFYDRLGSCLFDAITELDEYYPTRTEAGIVAAHATEMARAVPPGAVLIDLGAGNCAKAARLFPDLRPAAYIAVDISVDFLRDALGTLRRQYPALPLLGLGLDFADNLALPPEVLAWLDAQGLAGAPRCMFYPGSSIGNFLPAAAERLLAQAQAVCADGGPAGGLLIGVDRVKAPAVLEAAYDDALGVTAAFNRNLLRHVNRRLGSDFAPAHWRHVAFYNAAQARIEMHLESARDQTVSWPGGERRFSAGERLHTENSCKWTTEGFESLLRAAGFHPSAHWSDAKGWFSVFWATAGAP